MGIAKNIILRIIFIILISYSIYQFSGIWNAEKEYYFFNPLSHDIIDSTTGDDYWAKKWSKIPKSVYDNGVNNYKNETHEHLFKKEIIFNKIYARLYFAISLIIFSVLFFYKEIFYKRK